MVPTTPNLDPAIIELLKAETTCITEIECKDVTKLNSDFVSVLDPIQLHDLRENHRRLDL